MLYIFGGLPGAGKSTLSLQLAREIGALHLRIDTIEQALGDYIGSMDEQRINRIVAGMRLPRWFTSAISCARLSKPGATGVALTGIEEADARQILLQLHQSRPNADC